MALIAFCAGVAASGFGTPGGPEPANLAEVASTLRSDAWDLELLISYGTSKGGSAGHLALVLRDDASGDGVVYSANFYADRSPAHARGFHTDDLMLAIPKLEYLYRTSSSLGADASFGLDYGELYKRSVVGLRVYGVPAAERAALAAYFARINADYRARARDTEYHDGEVRYDYMQLNCAKTIGSAFRHGAGYRDLEIAASILSPRRKVATALNANVPTEMAMKLADAWHARGYRMDVVLYRKIPGSPWVDPHDEDKVAFKDLPDRFPSAISRDFLRDQGAYQDADNLYAMYLLEHLRRYDVVYDARTGRLGIADAREPLPFPLASARAAEEADVDSRGYRRLRPFKPQGTPIGAAPAAAGRP